MGVDVHDGGFGGGHFCFPSFPPNLDPETSVFFSSSLNGVKRGIRSYLKRVVSCPCLLAAAQGLTSVTMRY